MTAKGEEGATAPMVRAAREALAKKLHRNGTLNDAVRAAINAALRLRAVNGAAEPSKRR